MKKYYSLFVSSIMIALFTTFLFACGDDEDDRYSRRDEVNQENVNSNSSNNQSNSGDDNDRSSNTDEGSKENENSSSSYDEEMTRKLLNTSWHPTKQRFYNSDGSLRHEYNPCVIEGIITFGDNGYLYIINYKYGQTSHILNGYFKWKMKDKELQFICPSNEESLSYVEQGEVMGGIGVGGSIYRFSENEMIIRTDYNSGEYDDTYFKRVAYTAPDGGNNNGNDNNKTGDAPYITSFSYTSTKNSITVKFMASERPTSATIKYGEYSASKTITANITGKQISATATGLKPDTKYYFKCTVRNDNGSSTSDEYPAITDY